MNQKPYFIFAFSYLITGKNRMAKRFRNINHKSSMYFKFDFNPLAI